MLIVRLMVMGAIILVCIFTGCIATAVDWVATVEEEQVDRWLGDPPNVDSVRLQDGRVTLPSITGTFGDIRILSEHEGLPDVWSKTICEPDPMMLSYYISAPEGVIVIANEMLGAASFRLDHPDDIIQVMCVKRNVVRVFTRFNAGRRMTK